MGIPATVVAGFEILAAVRDGDVERASGLATWAGRRRLARILAAPDDPRAALLRARDHGVQGRIQGKRALCLFGELGDGRVAVLALRLKKGFWLLEDVVLLERSAFQEFGAVDDGPSNALG
jgi:hypothetical protein